MEKIRQYATRIIGIAGALFLVSVFIHDPSFPTPDKLIVFMIFVFMIFGQALEMLRRFGAFVIVILTYESFRSIADQLNSHVNYTLAPHIDKLMFGNLPTVYLQNWLWHGHVQWYDFVFYLPYLLHFILPLALGVIIWKNRDEHFWKVITAFTLVAFAGFFTFLLLPAAPPWLASDNHFIQPITRISSDVWYALGLHNFPSFYNHISPNQVAAIPSEHAAWASLFTIFVYKLYGWRWGLLSAFYPVIISFGVVYEGEHYVFDVLAGMLYAVGGYLAAPYVLRAINNGYAKNKHHIDRVKMVARRKPSIIKQP